MIDPNNNSVIYTGGYVYNGSTYVMVVSKSTNGGTTWERDTLTTTYSMCCALAVDKGNSNVVYAGGYNGYLFKTTNGGVTWFSSATGLSGTIYDIKIGSTKANTIYAGTSSGVFKSTNAGANWTNTGCTNVQAVLINPTNENEIYAATSAGVYKSTSGGGGWTLMNTGLQNTNTTSLGINPNNYVFVGTAGSCMYRWNIMVGAEEQNENILKIKFSASPNPSQGRTVIAYELRKKERVNISVYDIQGRLLKNLVNSVQDKGMHSAIWDGTDDKGARVADGIYFCEMSTGEVQAINKLILVR